MTSALRYNKGKPQYSLLDLECLEGCVRVLEFGAKKYSRDNWKKGLPTTQIIDSLLRHLGAVLRGELIDPESGLSHIGHIQCNALFLGNKNNTMDVDVNPLLPEDAAFRLNDDAIKALCSAKNQPASMEGYDRFVEGTRLSQGQWDTTEATKEGIDGHLHENIANAPILGDGGPTTSAGEAQSEALKEEFKQMIENENLRALFRANRFIPLCPHSAPYYDDLLSNLGEDDND